MGLNDVTSELMDSIKKGQKENTRYGEHPLINSLTEREYVFKNELIVNEQNELLASEFLLSNQPPCCHPSYQLDLSIKQVALNIIMQQLDYLLRVDPDVIPFRRIFVNMERHSFCEKELLHKVINVSKHLQSYDRQVVVETTERQYSHNSNDLIVGLERLKSAGVQLAMDDYEVTSDFRTEELRTGIYDYVKVDNPFFNVVDDPNTPCKKLELIHDLQNELDAKWIVERVDSQQSLVQLKQISFWGYQGFLFDHLLESHPEYTLF